MDDYQQGSQRISSVKLVFLEPAYKQITRDIEDSRVDLAKVCVCSVELFIISFAVGIQTAALLIFSFETTFCSHHSIIRGVFDFRGQMGYWISKLREVMKVWHTVYVMIKDSIINCKIMIIISTNFNQVSIGLKLKICLYLTSKFKTYI